MAKIKLEHVSMRFGDFYAVKDINLEVEEGEYITILGPSGCGKTSLIRVISGIWTPTEGRVYIDDTDVTDVPLEDRDVGYVFQNIALFPNMNNMKNVEYGPRVRAKSPKEREETAGKYLQLVNMLDRAQMFPFELSGGEQQRVAIARALAKNPELLLCDEPTGALDYVTGKSVLKLLHDLSRERHSTVIIITHNQAIAPMADRIIRIKSGRILSNDINRHVVPIEEIEW